MSEPKPRTPAQIAVQFKPGNKLGVAGRPKDILSKDEVQRLMGRLARLNLAELEAIIVDPKATLLEVASAAIMVKAAKRGDVNRLEFVLQRTIGKVKDELRVETPETVIAAEHARLTRQIMSDPETFEAAAHLAAKIARTKVLEDIEPPALPEGDEATEESPPAEGE